MSMAKVRDWDGMRAMSERLLEERTGEDVATWNRRTTPTFEDSRDDVRSDQPYFAEGIRHGSCALASTGVSRERVTPLAGLRILCGSRGTSGEVPSTHDGWQLQ